MSISALANQLIARGLIANPAQLQHVLETIGYFRLTGYLYPFRVKGSDNYIPGTTLTQVWDIYTFDRKLRLMMSDALARIEIAVRALIVTNYTLANPNDPFAYIDHSTLPGIKARKHTDLLNSIYRAVGYAKEEPDISHLKRAYGIEDYPPIWNVLEHSPFGVVTLF